MSVASQISQFDGPKVCRDHEERKAACEAERNAVPAPLLRAEAGPDAEVVAVTFGQGAMTEPVAGRDTVTLSSFSEARSVRVTADGRVYVVDGGNHRVLEVKDGAARVLVAGDGREDGEDLLRPQDAVALGDVLLLVDTGRSRLTACTGFETVVGQKGDRPVLSQPQLLLQPGGPRGKSSPEGLKFPRGICATKTALYLTDTWSHRLVRMDRPDFANLTAAGEQLAASAKHILGGGMPGATLDKLHFPTALVVEAEGDENGGDVLLMTDAMNHRVLRVTYKGPETPPAVEVVCGTGKAGVGPAELRNPAGLARLPDGTVFVADTDNRRVQRFAPGSSTGETLCSSPAPWGLAIDGSRLLITDLFADALLSAKVA
jgi:sugar lactone lactonase YvrE